MASCTARSSGRARYSSVSAPFKCRLAASGPCRLLRDQPGGFGQFTRCEQFREHERPGPTAGQAAGPGSLTAPGTHLAFGGPATVGWVPPSQDTGEGAHKGIKLQVTVLSIQKGTMADFRNVQLNGNQRNSTPYYVQLRVTALSNTPPPKNSDPAITFTAIDDRGQEQQSITFPRYRDRPRADNKEDLRQLAASGQPPGLLAFDGDRAVGWCELAPRAELAWLARARYLGPVDDLPVWSVPCFYVRSSHRGRGVMDALIEAAGLAAATAGAPALEAYPVDTTVPSHTGNLFPGIAAAFARHGFKEVARRKPDRPMMRKLLGPA